MIRFSLALALLCLAPAAHAEPIYGQYYSSPSLLLRSCKDDVAQAVREQKKAAPNGPKTRAVERLTGQLDAVRSGCDQWYRCQELCHTRMKADCKSKRGGAKRECKRQRRACKRGKCSQQTEMAACISPRNTFWQNLDQNLFPLFRGKPRKSLDTRGKAAKDAALSCEKVFPSTHQARVKNISKYH